MKQSLVITILLFSFITYISAQSLVIRIPDPSRTDYENLFLNGADIALYHPGMFLDLVIHEDELDHYKAKYPNLHITQTEAEMKANLGSRDRDIPGYRTYSDVVAELDQLVATYPSLIRMESIGSGWGKIYAEQGIAAYQDYAHDIWAVKLSDNVHDDEDEAQFLFVGAHHAREPISVETCMGIIYHLLENYAIDPRITAIMDNSEIWVVPLLNPDGHKVVLDQTQMMWRKNLNDNNANQQIDLGPSGSGLDGVDVNRNYSYMWGNVSSTDNFMDSVYHGSHPFSEPESSALRDLVLSKHFLASISYHSYGRYVLYPFGFADDVSGPDLVEQRLLAQEMGTLSSHLAMPSHDLYPVSGSCEDWMLGVGGLFAYTIEMANQFIPNASQVQALVQEQIPAALALLERINYKCLTGHVSDAVTGNPLQAQIYLASMDNHVPQRAAVYSRADFGSYHRFLPEGTHQVIASAPAYVPQTVTVQISNNGITIQDFALQPASSIPASFQILDTLGNPLPGTLLELDDLQFVADAGGLIDPGLIHESMYMVKASLPGYCSYARRLTLLPGLNVIRLSSDADAYDGFEEGDGNWILSGNWGIGTGDTSFGDHWLGDNPAQQSSTPQSSATYGSTFNPAAAESFSVSFHARLALTGYSEYVVLQYQNQGEQEWHTLMILMGESPWQKYEQDLSFLNGRRVSLRFLKNNQFTNTANSFLVDEFRVFGTATYSDVQDLIQSPALLNIAPNPFSREIVISSSNLPKGAIVANIYNLRGQKVMSWQTNHLTEDPVSFSWNGVDHRGRDLPSGIYFVRFSLNHNTLATRKILKL